MIRRLPDTSELLRYLCAGATSNLLVLAVYYSALHGGHLEPKLSLTLAAGVGFFVAYSLNRVWTFRFAGGSIGSLARYGAGYLGSFCLQWSILHLGVDRLGFSPNWVVLFGLGCATVVFYVVQRLWVFAKAGHAAMPARPTAAIKE